MGMKTFVVLFGVLRLTHGLDGRTTLSRTKTCPETTSLGGVEGWETDFWASDCMVPVNEQRDRATTVPLNMVIIAGYQGIGGNVLTMAAPMLKKAAQEIEDSGLLPGYHMTFQVADSLCNNQEATAMTIRVMSEDPPKHGLIGDQCSGACGTINDAIQPFNVLHMSPICVSTDLSDRARHPYFVRGSPSAHWFVAAVHGVFKMLGFKRVGVVYFPITIANKAALDFKGLVEKDQEDGTHDWTLLMMQTMWNFNDAKTAVAKMKQMDSRINFASMYEAHNNQLMCALHVHGVSAPEFLIMYATGWYDPKFWDMPGYNGGGVSDECTPEEIYRASHGTMGADKADMEHYAKQPGLMHGLSGSSLRDVEDYYYEECKKAAGGTGDTAGACNFQMGYWYDSVWHYAALLHAHLIEERGTFVPPAGQTRYDSLLTAEARHNLWELSLSMDYQGLTGRFRQFNESTAVPGGAHGDRDGDCRVRQIQGGEYPNGEFITIGLYSPSGVHWLTDIKWDLDDATKKVPCATGTCDLENAWIPADRKPSGCNLGAVWSVELGCTECPAGKSAPSDSALECLECDAGRFTNEPGMSECEGCPKGSASPKLAATECIQCEAGLYAGVEGASACDRCERSTYSATPGTEACTQCPSGLTTVNVASLAVEDCVCPEGQYKSATNGSCMTCSRGLDCNTGSLEANIQSGNGVYPMVAEGYYTTKEDPLSVYLCGTEEACPGGQPDSCAEARTGLVCAQCAEGYYGDGENCLKCQELFMVPMLWPALFCCLVPPGLLIAYFFQSNADADRWYRPMQALSQLAFLAVNFAQLTALHGVLDLKRIPMLWANTAKGTEFTLNPASLIMPECNDFRGFTALHTGQMLLPSLCGALTLAAVGLAKVVGLAKKSFDVGMAGSGIGDMFGSLYLALYMSCATRALALFMCYPHPNGGSSVRSSPEILCNQTEWNSMVGITVVGVLINCVLSLVVVGYLLRVAPQYYSSSLFRMGTKFIFKRFRTGRGAWVLVLLFKGLWVAFASVGFTEADGQIMWLNFGLLSYLIATTLFLPYRHMPVNVLDILIHACLLYIFNGSTFFVENQESILDRMGVVNTSIAISVYVCFLFAGIFQCLQIYKAKYTTALEDANKVLANQFWEACNLLAKQPKQLEELVIHLAWIEKLALDKIMWIANREVNETSMKSAGHVQILFRKDSKLCPDTQQQNQFSTGAVPLDGCTDEPSKEGFAHV